MPDTPRGSAATERITLPTVMLSRQDYRALRQVAETGLSMWCDCEQGECAIHEWWERLPDAD